MKVIYRVGAAIIALAVFPLMWTQKFIAFAIDVSLGEDGFILKDEFSLSQIYYYMTKDGGSISMPDIAPEMLETLKPLKFSAILCLVFLLLVVLIPIAIIICSAFTNAKKVNLGLSFAGIISSLGAIISFRSMSQIVISGELPLSKIINVALAASDGTITKLLAFFGAGNLATSIAELQLFQLGSAVVMQVVVFCVLAAWCGSFILINIGEKK